MIELKDTNPKTAAAVSKPSLSVVPASVLMELSVAMTEGALKYGRHNYRHSGASASVYYDSTMRHLMAWFEGENIDPASGLNHVTKAIAGLVVLRDAMIQGKFNDDRPPVSQASQHNLQHTLDNIHSVYGHLQPKHYTELNKDEQ